jgi:tRNA 2-thiouridine synthesizing protein C
MAKSVLFVFRHSPYGSALAREGLDALLAAAVYEQDVAVLFVNDGVFQLLDQQQVASDSKNHAKMLSALPIYGVDKLYVDEASLGARGLQTRPLLLDAQKLNQAQTTKVMASFDHILSF